MVVDRWARRAEASRIVQWVPQLLLEPNGDTLIAK
jgi:hypothetical protein